ncbi:MAG: tetrapyrrole methylase [Planctomycetaceae bacterium]|nr:MAG: tetrapyrrole methylase [Planctomycetaceae bacterium]
MNRWNPSRRIARNSWIVVILVLIAAVAQPAVATQPPTQLYLVGVGPGDPDLITLRAIETIKRADVIFCMESLKDRFSELMQDKQVIHGYWRLFPFYGQDLEDLEGAQRVEAEKLAVRRNEFIALVRQAIEDGETVAIVDSGDPLIYGPWAWTMEEFKDLQPVVVPGVSAFNAGNAALRRGITNSDFTNSVILTAADWEGKTDTIERLSTHRTTMALFTMRTEFEEFVRKLAINYPADTPLAVVKYAGYADREQVIQATVGTILEKVGQDDLPFEYMIYVGEFLTFRYRKEK